MKAEKNIFETFIKNFSKFLMAVGAVFLMLMMFLTALDVVFRYIMNSPIAGALEIVEYMMAVLIPFSIAYCAFQRSHVAVDLIFENFPKIIQKGAEIITIFLSFLFISAITWENILYIGEVYTSKMTSAVLLIPSYPFVIPTALGCLVFSLILLLHLYQAFREAE